MNDEFLVVPNPGFLFIFGIVLLFSILLYRSLRLLKPIPVFIPNEFLKPLLGLLYPVCYTWAGSVKFCNYIAIVYCSSAVLKLLWPKYVASLTYYISFELPCMSDFWYLARLRLSVDDLWLKYVMVWLSVPVSP